MILPLSITAGLRMFARIFLYLVRVPALVRESFPKKSSCSFGFCPNLSTFHKLFMLGQFGDGEGGGDPWPNFLADWRSKKVVRVVQIRGTGGGENLDKIQKNSYFFFGRPSLI